MRVYIKVGLYIVLFFLPTLIYSQVGINSSGLAPHSDAMLDISSPTKGLLLPRISLISTTLASPLSSHVKGMLVYNIANSGDVSDGYYYNDGTTWVRIAQSNSVVSSLGVPSGSNLNGGSISSSVLSMSFADSINPGIVSTGTQIFGGQKSFNRSISILNGNSMNFYGSSSGNIGIMPPALVTSYSLTLPNAQASTVGMVLSNNGSGLLSWESPILLGSPTNSIDSKGATVNTNTLTLGYATNTYPGIISIGSQTLSGQKTFSTGITLPTGAGANYVLKSNSSGDASWSAPKSLGILHGQISASQTTNIGIGDHIKFNDNGLFSNGSKITLDKTSAYSTGTGTSLGRIKLLSGYTYKLTGNIKFISGSAAGGYIVYQWYNVTSTATSLGTKGVLEFSTESTRDGNSSSALAFITTSIDTYVELRIIVISDVVNIGSTTYGLPEFIVEEIPLIYY